MRSESVSTLPPWYLFGSGFSEKLKKLLVMYMNGLTLLEQLQTWIIKIYSKGQISGVWSPAPTLALLGPGNMGDTQSSGDFFRHLPGIVRQ